MRLRCLARARPPRRVREAPTRTPSTRTCSRWLAGLRLPPPRSGRGRCTARQPPNARRSPRCALRMRLARSRSLSPRRPRLPCPARPEASARSRARSRYRSPPPRCRPRPCSRRHPPGRRSMHAPCPTRRGGAAAAQARRHRGRAGPASPRSRARRRCPIPRCWPPWPSSPSARRPPPGCLANPRCSLQRRSRCGASVGRQQGEPGEQQVERTRSSRPPGEVQDGAGDLQQDASSSEMPGGHRRGAPGGQVGLACELRIESLEPPRSA